MIKKIIFIIALMFTVTTTVHADWYMELGNVDGTITAGDYYIMPINIVTDDSNFNINDFYLTIDYDETLVSYIAYDAMEYDDGVMPFPTVLWECPLPEHDTGEVVYNILGSESLGHIAEFLPGAGTILMGDVWFQALVSGTYSDIGVFVDGPSDDLITTYQNTIMFPDLIQTKVGNAYQLSPVPIPGAVWLLGSGLIGLIGIRRKKA